MAAMGYNRILTEQPLIALVVEVALFLVAQPK
jgi:hypothetical protein